MGGTSPTHLGAAESISSSSTSRGRKDNRISSGTDESRCPGCGLSMPPIGAATYDGYFNTSQECWSVFTEVIGAEFSNAALFGQVHQLTVDAYAVQHAGGRHPHKSVCIHLTGLYLVLERGRPPPSVPPHLPELAAP